VSIDLMESTLRSHVPWPVKFSAASDLEDPPFDQEPYRQKLAEALRHGFGEKPDLVIAVMDPSLRFALQYRARMFPDVPIVFMSISSPKASQQMYRWPGVTGVVSSVGVRETLDLALHLHPDTKAIAVITNVSDTEKDYFVAVQAELLRHQDKIREIDVIGPPNGALLERIATLPSHTVALFQLWPHDSDQVTVNEVVSEVAKRLPTYCIFTGLCVDLGGIGGAYTDPRNDAVLTGELAARVLEGAQVKDLPLEHNSALQIEVDWRELRYWHIPESALPAGSVILYRPPTLWQSYRKYFVATIVVIAVLLLLIIGLLWERLRKRKAEAALRESEKRFRVMADTTPSLVWMCDTRGNITYLNERSTAFTGSDSAAGYGDSWTAYVHPDDLRNVKDGMAQGLEDRQPFSREYRLRRSDGVYRWMFDVASPRVNGDGSFGGFIGSAIDVTDQKLAQQALEQVSGQLIEAQEKERSRIARDLHDDICQRLALLSMEIEQTNRATDGSPAATKRSLEEIRRHCSEIAGDVQSLSHQLHSSKLEYLGVAAAIRGFCQEFSRQHEVTISFTEENVPRHLPKDISLCLFRVTQEALHNATKYSGVSQFGVELMATPDDIQLVVSDSGTGFDVDEAKKNRGLGLVSMQERVHLVHGTLAISSTPGTGTTILAVVPLPTDNGGLSENRLVEEDANVT
jgi:PAS domain S-box-containing protein